ncbi:electron transfer flavoprotein alpha subunit apoprotein [Sphaerotilus hippei]|uniref:Electron transfer flavoprotein alpha subunit apoprotein n=1 Tax=Sphaerotilus hippei TaxID=744406 RepID=A0A318H5X6_9BURK|nr:electron transfer flavoprotein subunit alpha/FixB family protein [Sphaerotilus hippei]PXW99315.1 electron transfer flavoprotein alpha subunit apoprotein [Sphaerotilus hippei]
MTRRIDPRRPALITPLGRRRIVLGSERGDREPGRLAGDGAATLPQRLSAPARGCLLVIAHTDRGSLDEHARETIAATVLLARPDEAVVLIAPVGPGFSVGDEAAALGVDRIEQLPVDDGTSPEALLEVVRARWTALSPRHTLLPDRGADADLGRRLAVVQGLVLAGPVVEIHADQVRIRHLGRCTGGPDSAPGDALAPLPALLLLARQVARTALHCTGLGERIELPAPQALRPAGLTDLGIVAGQARQIALEEAEFIVAAGNGVTDVALFHELAEALGAAIGASRVAVDDGRFTRPQQIGATGKTVQARGYLSFGISGAVQHLQGIRECRHVMAVNTDAAAPMVRRAELTVVEDAQALMRSMLEQVRAERRAKEALP